MSKLWLIRKFFYEPGQIKCMMIEAVVYSAYYRYQITHKPFRTISPKIGTFQYETPEMEIQDGSIQNCSRAVNCACRYVPWDSKCLDQALAAKKILNKRGMKCTMYMGIKQDKNQELVAHAWLRCGNYAVTGGTGKDYAVTGIYGDE